MAYAKTTNLSVPEEQLKKMGRPMIKKIVEAGAGAAEKVMRDVITEYGHVRNKDLVNSVKPWQYREWLGGGSQEVFSQGDNRRGARLLTVAYVINYGRGGQQKNKDGSDSKMGDHFMDEVDARGEAEATQAMQAESDRLMAEIGAE